MSSRVMVFAALASIAVAACAENTPTVEGDLTTPSEDQVVAERAPVGELQLSVEGGVRGTFTLGGEVVSFASVAREGRVYELTVKARSITLDATVDVANRTSSFDGFGAAAGDDVLFEDGDRALVEALYRSLNARAPANAPEAFKILRRAVGVWAENPASVPLGRLVYGDEGRGYTMLCSYARCGGSFTGSCSSWNWFNYAKHDCNQGGFDNPKNQQSAQLGDHFSCSGDEFYWNGSGWTCGEPDHKSRPSVVGNCFGRCGGGCGGDTQYTLDATNHDGCVRNGHVLASGYCDDQFISASDDELFAPDCY
jgi:hypothetical protein